MKTRFIGLTAVTLFSLTTLSSASDLYSDAYFMNNTSTALHSQDNIVVAAVSGDLKGGNVIESEPSPTETGDKKRIFEKDFNALSIQEAFNEGAETSNVAMYEYDISKSYPIYMRVDMSTLVNLPKWEVIKAFSLANDEHFTVTNFADADMQNQVIVQSFLAGVDTNLIIIGESGNIYNFYLRNLGVNSDLLPHFSVYVSGTEPRPYAVEKAIKSKPKDRKDYFDAITEPIDQTQLEQAKADYLKSLDKPEGVNLNYAISGDEEIAPKAVYDRRGWTYFDFRGVLPSDRLPTLYKVIDEYDAVQNYRFKDGFLIAESTSIEGWTLRNGDKVVCIERE